MSKTTIGDYNICFPLNSGTSSDVFFAQHKLAPVPVAIKVINNPSPETRELLHREIEVMKALDHPNIITLFDVIEDDEKIAFIMEYADNGSLLSFMVPNRPMPEQQIRAYFSQICNALLFMHEELRICHRDIKADNILLDSNFHIKLSDFGLSKQIQTIDDSKSSLMTTQCGSPYYVSPEIIKMQPYDESTDVWSLGVLLYLMATGQFPFNEQNIPKLLHKIVNDPITIPEFLSDDLVDLISQMLQKVPEDRIKLNDILIHQFLGNPGPKKSISLPMLNAPGFQSESNNIGLVLYEMENLGLGTPEINQKIKDGDPQIKKLMVIISKKVEEKQRRLAAAAGKRKKIPMMGKKLQVSGTGMLPTFKKTDIVPQPLMKRNKVPIVRSVFIP